MYIHTITKYHTCDTYKHTTHTITKYHTCNTITNYHTRISYINYIKVACLYTDLPFSMLVSAIRYVAQTIRPWSQNYDFSSLLWSSETVNHYNNEPRRHPEGGGSEPSSAEAWSTQLGDSPCCRLPSAPKDVTLTGDQGQCTHTHTQPCMHSSQHWR